MRAIQERQERQEQRLKRDQQLARQADDDLAWVMSDKRGRRFVWSELGRNGLHVQTYSPNNSEQCFRSGERNAALKLMADVMRVSPERYLLMQQEAIEQERINASINEQGNDND